MAAGNNQKQDDGIPPAVKAAEGKALSALWKARRKRSQEEFATEMGFSQGNFSHYIGGRRPIPLDIGLAIAKELGCSLEDFSPRLAKEHRELKEKPLVTWPFQDLLPQRISKLSPGQLKRIEGLLMEELEQIEIRTQGRQRAVNRD